MYYPCSENKGADQLRSYREADLRLCFRICRLLVFSSMTDRLSAFLCVERMQYMAYHLYVYSKEDCRAIHFSWLGPELLVCCLAHWGSTVVFFSIRRPRISIVRQLTEFVSPSF